MIASGLLPPRPRDAHKGSCGQVAICAGSRGMAGAAALCAMGALRAGAGLVKLAVPSGILDALAAKLTEPILVPLAETKQGTVSRKALDALRDLAAESDVLAVGPGLSQADETKTLIRDIVATGKTRMVLDADGLNGIAGAATSLRSLRGRAVLTPHPGELARLLHSTAEKIQEARLETTIDFAKRHGVVTILKGADTVVADPNGSHFINETGNAGMASGGMGDVLTGIIAALIGQKLSLYDAACLGVYLHGLAGDIAKEELGGIGLIASDVAVRIPLAIRRYQTGAPHPRC